MADGAPARELLGRSREIERLGRLIEATRQGESGVLVVRGEPGVGKTALVDHVVGSVAEVRVLRAVGVEREMEPFAALQQLCAPVLDQLDGLPGPQRDARSISLVGARPGYSRVRPGGEGMTSSRSGTNVTRRLFS